MIHWFNNQGKHPFIKPLGLDTTPVSRNYWLSGLLDADSSFQITFKISPITSFVIDLDLTMRLTQRLNYHVLDAVLGSSYLPIITLISEALNCNVTTQVRQRVNSVESNCGVFVKTLASRLALIGYLSKYPLMSSKRLDSLDWIKAHDISVSKGYKYLEGTAAISSLKNGMNDKRTVFDWSHL